MARLKIGSKSEVFHLDGLTWVCSAGLPSDVVIEVGETSFHLHKFPLLSRSKVLEDLIAESSSKDERKCVVQLHDIPGGAKTFLLIAKFCYDVKIELNSLNIVSLRCAAEYLQMNDNYGERNLITQTENFLNEIFGNWSDSLKALETCEEVLTQAEELHIVSRCINSLAMKACADPSVFSWPLQGCDEAQSTQGPVFWNGICTSAKPHPVGEDWWHDDVSFLRLPLYKRLILAVGSHGMKPEGIAGAIIHYSKRHLSLLGRDLSTQWGNYAAPGSTISATNEAEQRNLLEEIVELVPEQKGVTPSKFLLRLLRTAILINASPSCRETLEKRIGAQLDQAALEDLLIPSTGYSVETLYDIDCVQRILDHFMLVDSDHFASNYIEEEQLMESSHSLTPVTMVANLMDSYLAEVAPDVNLKPKQFQSLAAAIPDYARPVDDGIYRAIDIYLKAHPWLTESEREQLCRLMSCQKFSLEASTHAAQNERLPLRVIIQVLFFEQLRLRTSISSWFFVSDNLESSLNASGNLTLTRNDEPAQEVNAQDRIVAVDAMKKRVCELEKECSNMKQEIDKLVKTKGGWNTWLKKLGFSKQKPKAEDSKVVNPTKSKSSQASSAAALLNGGQNQNGLSGD